MAKQFWEVESKLNNFGKPEFVDDCEITIVALGAAREWANKGKTYVFRKITVVGPNNVEVGVGMELMYFKGEDSVLPQDLNAPLPCSIKVAGDTTQYAYNGRKYTIKVNNGEQPAKKKSYTAKAPAGHSYTPTNDKEVDWDKIGRGKCFTVVLCAAIQNGQMKCTSLADCEMFADACMLASK